jgi:hypothetical protein
MAKQVGLIKLEGVFGDVLFYKMEGQYYARMHNPVSKKKFWKHPAFEGSRRSSERLTRGSKLASQVYRSLQGATRVYALYCVLKKEAIGLLKIGTPEEAVLQRLRELVAPAPRTRREERQRRRRVREGVSQPAQKRWARDRFADERSPVRRVRFGGQKRLFSCWPVREKQALPQGWP